MDVTTEEEYDGKQPYMRGLGCFSDFCPAEAVVGAILRNGTSLFQGGNNIGPFFVSQETRRFRRPRKEEKRDHSKYKGKYAFLSRPIGVSSDVV